MTFLLVTDDVKQGQSLTDLLVGTIPGSLCLTVAPGDLEASLMEIRVDCVVCPAALSEYRPDQRPRFVPWPEGKVTEAWVCALQEKAAAWNNPKRQI